MRAGLCFNISTYCFMNGDFVPVKSKYTPNVISTEFPLFYNIYRFHTRRYNHIIEFSIPLLKIKN